MNCPGHEDELWLYAAEALDEPGRRQVIEAHLAGGCPRCHADLAEARQRLGHLPLALEPASPSPAVRQRLLARIRQPRGGGRLWPWAAAAAAAVLVALLLLWPTQPGQEMARLEGFLDAVLESFSADEPTDELIERIHTSAAVLSTLRSPEHELISFRGVPEHERARAHLLWDAGREEAYLFVTDLDPPGEHEQSRLWLHTHDDRHLPVKAVAWDEQGMARMQLRWPVEIQELAGASISYDEREDVAEPMRPVLLARMR